MITTSFIILKYALSSTGIFVIHPNDYEKIQCGDDNSFYDDNYLIHQWNGERKECLNLYKSAQYTFYHNHGPKHLAFVPNTPVGRARALDYINYIENKSLAAMAKKLTSEAGGFTFPSGTHIKHAIRAKKMIKYLDSY